MISESAKNNEFIERRVDAVNGKEEKQRAEVEPVLVLKMQRNLVMILEEKMKKAEVIWEK